MCEKAVKKYLWLLKYVPDYFVTDEQIKIWHGNDEYCNDNDMIEWFEGYQIRKAKKSLNKRRTSTHSLAPIKALGLVYVRRRKTRDRKIMDVKKWGFFVSDDRMQKNF